MIKKFFLLVLLILPIACQSIKDGLSGKKNPLVLPPDFKDLPVPQEQDVLTREETIESEIEEVISSIKSESLSNKKKVSSGSSSTEDFVINQIKK